jgi:hypothetical protein
MPELVIRDGYHGPGPVTPTIPPPAGRGNELQNSLAPRKGGEGGVRVSKRVSGSSRLDNAYEPLVVDSGIKLRYIFRSEPLKSSRKRHE